MHSFDVEQSSTPGTHSFDTTVIYIQDTFSPAKPMMILFKLLILDWNTAVHNSPFYKVGKIADLYVENLHYM